ncbi:olfactory receptor 1A1-like [Orycteropus afer afer]|uniref:Olfactory receptor 1A1-like n=1 Tax=Orycteropus afer afer TaxID=1230840 RepID=A0A8B6ZJ21_ORYAF|nr:olfactory receptor 1A1-like [Orycteropus afer afer]
MEPGTGTNRTTLTEFILLGLVESEKLQSVVFVLFFFAYMVTVGGNLSILAAILMEPKLHTPMYFFLGNLSVLDVVCITVTVPPMLHRLLSHKRTISYYACLSQLFFFHLLAGMDCFLLTAMAYDRFLAICRPLTYSIRMSQEVQRVLVAGSWVIGIANSLPHTLFTANLSFCGNHEVANFYCDISSLLKLSCSDINLNVKMMYVGVGFFCAPLIGIIISYIQVFATVLRVPSTKGMLKAFSTCGSHLTVVSLYYGTVMGMYFRPLTSYSLKDGVITAMYTAVTPLLNPFIYSLRNRDMKAALRKLFSKNIS